MLCHSLFNRLGFLLSSRDLVNHLHFLRGSSLLVGHSFILVGGEEELYVHVEWKLRWPTGEDSLKEEVGNVCVLRAAALKT